jgi:hypothetical protein
MILALLALMRADLGKVVDELACLALDLGELLHVHEKVLPVCFEELGHLDQGEVEWLDRLHMINLLLAQLLLGSGNIPLLGFDALDVLDVLHLGVILLVAQHLLVHELLLLVGQRVSLLQLVGEVHQILLEKRVVLLTELPLLFFE